MDTNKIREALKEALAIDNRDNHGPRSMYTDMLEKALAELDKAQQPGRMLTDEEIKRIVENDITEMSHVGLAPNDAAALKMSRAFMERGLRHAIEFGYLAPAVGLTVEEVKRLLRDAVWRTGNGKALKDFYAKHGGL